MRLRLERQNGLATSGRACLALALVAWASAGGGFGCLTTPPPPGCLDNPTVVAASANDRDYAFPTTGYTLDARGIDWVGQEIDGVDIDGPGAGCFVGGRIEGTWDQNDAWDLYHGRKGLPNGLLSKPLIVEKTHLLNFGDGVAIEISGGCTNGGGTWLVVRGSHLEDMHDDAVESDRLCGAEVDDNLIDRAFTAVAFRNRTNDPNRDGKYNTVNVRNNLIRLHSFPNNGEGQPEHNGVWKWAHQNRGPKIQVRFNRFLAFDAPPGGTLFPFVNKVTSCESNVFLFAGSEAEWQSALLGGCDTKGDDGLCDGERLLALSSCFTVITKPDTQSEAEFLATHWDPYVTSWKNSHPADNE